MIDDQLILSIERLRDSLKELKSALHAKYKEPKQQVVAVDIRKQAAQLCEAWLVELSTRPEVTAVIAPETSTTLKVRFQRLLLFSEAAAQRARYDTEIKAILKTFSLDVIVPLKQQRDRGPTAEIQGRMLAKESEPFQLTAFVGHSFAEKDASLVGIVVDALKQLGIKVETGEKPRADFVSAKIMKLIDAQYLFVGIFTRRDKISGKPEYTTSPWVSDEKAYAVAKNKKMILLLESGVRIGGLQGDYEYLSFDRNQMGELIVRLLKLFRLSLLGLS